MYRTTSFKKKILATAIASAAVAVNFSGIAHAQDSSVEEVVVTGIRASVAQAMDVKRNATGVVDAISSEDIGKMPDANLAESLQRITGLSIDRSNGEGSRVAVRGIDPALNMVTLNGRNMPAVTNGTTSGIEINNTSRAFDFSNLASEVVNGVEVYKTGNASITSGGLGATINIKTLRPLDLGATKATIAAKAVQDETVDNGVKGDEITPELSGLFSWVNDDETFGVTLTGAYQERDNTRSNVFVNNWQLKTAGAATDTTSDGTLPLGASVVNAPAAGQLYNLPSDLRYSLEDNNRVRQNGQLTLQFRPVDKLTTTLDYTYSENELTADRSQQSTWYNISQISRVEFDDNLVKTPLIYQEVYAPSAGKDVSFAQQYFKSTSQNNSFGINLAYEATDDLRFELDYHDSSANNIANQGEAGLNANIVTGNFADFSGDMPVMGISINDGYVTPEGRRYGNANGVLDGGDVSGAMGTISHASQDTEIEQLRLMGSYNFGDAGIFSDMGIGFGVEARDDKNQTRIGDGTSPRLTMGNWGGVDPAVFGTDWAGYFSPRDFGDSFPDYDATTENPLYLSGDFGLDADPYKVFEKMEYMFNAEIDPTNFQNFPNGKAQWNGVLGTNRIIEEEVKSAYVQFKTGLELAMPANLVVGMRYEETDVTSTSIVKVPSMLQWDSDNDWSVLLSEGLPTRTSLSASYDNFLPNIDFDISPIDDLKLRLSYSKTMGRAAYNDLRVDTGINSAYSKTANTGNVGLKPMESENIDLSAEWYYNDDSYLSLGYFRKEVSNFIGATTVVANWYGLRDVRNGPRFTQAIADIAAANGDIDSEAAQHTQMLINDGKDPADPSTSVYADESDPLLDWVTNVPVNDQDNTIDGLEFAVQHWFSDSGFGVQANYTMVDEDKSFDITRGGGQSGMIGLSDSANLVGFFDRDAWQVRVAYNWRDKFLSSRTRSDANEPGYTEEFGQVDFSISYELNENVSFTAEGLNVTGEDSRVRGRSEHQLYSLEDLGARYQVGVRYTF